ncbi:MULTISPECIES: biopolymer transporter ExbD [unclassified Janthinobacterium]|uniref:biopolymer transporter ExbD n=1 Tax=unclassified Janthinobacterium TaxID=2610881 RepID=UPI00160CD566|nr:MULTISPECIES: biopolymer transporter ExbD [unclassified Janthinobacterium]MBB5609358.1 biopolymer transport protein ExbD [Janthinobacterium sp. S3T4]MBB5614531.1 biopolymer transport protein ExbD [Janthinobacterium sp. S3M3]
MFTIKAIIKDDVNVQIDGKNFTNRHEIVNKLSNLLNTYPGAALHIEADSNTYFRAIGNIIYASQQVGVPKENISITTPEGNIFK